MRSVLKLAGALSEKSKSHILALSESLVQFTKQNTVPVIYSHGGTVSIFFVNKLGLFKFSIKTLLYDVCQQQSCGIEAGNLIKSLKTFCASGNISA